MAIPFDQIQTRTKTSQATSTVRMERMASDDLQTIQNRNRSPPRSPFLATLLRRQSKTDSRHSDIHFKEQRRIVVLGDAKVGKSSIIRKFLYDQFTPKYSRTIEDLHVADYNLSSGASLTLEILDTTGSYQFPAMRALSISNAHAFLLVYSVGDLESWRRIQDLRYEIIYARGPDVPIVIAGNKSDELEIERAVPLDVVEETAKHWRCGYIECNVKENRNVIAVFAKILFALNIHYDLAEAVCRRRRSYPVYSGKTRTQPVESHACSIS